MRKANPNAKPLADERKQTNLDNAHKFAAEMRGLGVVKVTILKSLKANYGLNTTAARDVYVASGPKGRNHHR